MENYKKEQEKALEKRLSGELPIIDIAGQIFYVDLGMDCLRPKDKFHTMGIRFSEIKEYYSWLMEDYALPYNPKKPGLEKANFDDLESIPEDILLVEFPSKRILDPVAYARIHGYDTSSFAKKVGVQSHFKAKTRPLKAHLLEQRRLDKEFRKSLQEENKPTRKRRKGKGRSL